MLEITSKQDIIVYDGRRVTLERLIEEKADHRIWEKENTAREKHLRRRIRLFKFWNIGLALSVISIVQIAVLAPHNEARGPVQAYLELALSAVISFFGALVYSE